VRRWWAAVRDLVRIPGGAAGGPARAPSSGSLRCCCGTGAPGAEPAGPPCTSSGFAAQRFGEPALGPALAQYRAALDTRRAELDAVEDELSVWAARPLLAAAVARIGRYRGVAELNGLTLAAEVVDWRRFPSARAFMCFTGLVSAEYSSGEPPRPRLDHQSGLGRRPHGADRGGLVLPAPARDRRHLAPPLARRGP